jgi:ElaB/YqjD/DUF883 family membrane-anchored ribosome-binding protein
MNKSFSDQAEVAGQKILDGANRSLHNASEGLQSLSDDTATVVTSASRAAADMTKAAGARAASATEQAAAVLADEFKRHPAATFAAVLGALAAMGSVLFAVKRLGKDKAG